MPRNPFSHTVRVAHTARLTAPSAHTAHAVSRQPRPHIASFNRRPSSHNNNKKRFARKDTGRSLTHRRRHTPPRSPPSVDMPPCRCNNVPNIRRHARPPCRRNTRRRAAPSRAARWAAVATELWPAAPRAPLRCRRNCRTTARRAGRGHTFLSHSTLQPPVPRAPSRVGRSRSTTARAGPSSQRRHSHPR